ncbi:MAG: hypothetical protein ACKVS9_11290 [Phycisphaerae bacterium]
MMVTRCVLISMGWVLLLLGGCGPSGSSQAAAPPTPPKQVLRKLIELRAASKYAELSKHVVPSRAAETVQTLMAVDSFLHANEALIDHVTREVSPGLARVIDQSRLGQAQDVFSRGVDLLDEVISGDAAQVAFTIESQIPARTARFRLVGGQWLLDPGDGYHAAIPAAFERMAVGLRQTLEELRSGRMSAAQLTENPQKLIDDVRTRLTPGLSMLPE